MPIFAVAVAGLVFLAQFFYRRRLQLATRFFFLLGVAVVLGATFYSAFARYQDWHEGTFTQYLLPPYQSADYFLADVGKKFFAAPLIALLAALILPRIAEFLNKKYEERFFYGEEFGLMRLGIFLVGYPGFLFYLVLVLGAGLALSYLFLLLGKGRAPFLYFWMPAAVLTIVLINWVLPEIVAKRFAL